VRVVFSETAWGQYLHWATTDRDVLARINLLIEDARRNLFAGIGQPEPLANNLSGFWSRRITKEHRLVYRIIGRHGIDQSIEIASCRYHYRKN
jgi:toxin YoeB